MNRSAASLAKLRAALAAAGGAAGAFDGRALSAATVALRDAAAELDASLLTTAELAEVRTEVAGFAGTCAFLGNTLRDALVRAEALPAAGYGDASHPQAPHTRPLVERYG